MINFVDDIITLFQNTFNLRRSGVAIFAEIIKTVTITTTVTQEKSKEFEIMYQNSVYIYIS